jgi:hypothetical protein
VLNNRTTVLKAGDTYDLTTDKATH